MMIIQEPATKLVELFKSGFMTGTEKQVYLLSIFCSCTLLGHVILTIPSPIHLLQFLGNLFISKKHLKDAHL